MFGISVIICCYNGANRIKNVLSHIHNQINLDKIDYEIIFVNNACSDNTREVVINCRDELGLNLEIYDEPNPGLINARKLGIKKSTKDIVIFVDDDNYLDDDFFVRVLNLFENEEISFLGGASRLPTDYSISDFFKKHLQCYAVGEQFKCDGYLSDGAVLWGAGLCVRRQCLIEISNDEFKCAGRTSAIQLAGDDSELCYKLLLNGKLGFYSSSLKLTHAIDPNRFNEEKLEQMFKGFGASAPYLMRYRAKLFTNSFKVRIKYFLINKYLFLLFSLSVKYFISKAKGDRYMISYYGGAISTLINNKRDFR
ncbi:glycosyltransferase family 2 protein [Plesiomonas shigelloides]|uniref:glycosyltransferase n=1 Tax=Plesiomonas shigelloides TaxID=703 RepID=UPI0030BEC11A